MILCNLKKFSDLKKYWISKYFGISKTVLPGGQGAWKKLDKEEDRVPRHPHPPHIAVRCQQVSCRLQQSLSSTTGNFKKIRTCGFDSDKLAVGSDDGGSESNNKV